MGRALLHSTKEMIERVHRSFIDPLAQRGVASAALGTPREGGEAIASRNTEGRERSEKHTEGNSATCSFFIIVLIFSIGGDVL